MVLFRCMKNRRRILIGIVFLIVIGGVYVYVSSKSNPDTSLTTFTHPTGLYTIKFPSNWESATDANGNAGLSYAFWHVKKPAPYEEYGRLTFDGDINSTWYSEPSNTTSVTKEKVIVDGFNGYKYTDKNSPLALMYIINLDPEKKINFVIFFDVGADDTSGFSNQVNNVITSLKINKDKIAAYEKAMSFSRIAQNLYDSEVTHYYYEKLSRTSNDTPLQIDKDFDVYIENKVNAINKAESMSIDFKVLVENNPLKPIDPAMYKIMPKAAKNVVFKIGDKDIGLFFCSSTKGYQRQVTISLKQFSAKTDCLNRPLNQALNEFGLPANE